MKIAVIQVRGGMNTAPKVMKTLQLLNLRSKNSCVLVETSPVKLGMLVALKDYITWGEANEETIKMLIQKRGRLAGNQILTEEYVKKQLNLTISDFAKAIANEKHKLRDLPGMKPYFRLTPPKGGYEIKGTKKQYSIGGALGYRKEAINDLIRRML